MFIRSAVVRALAWRYFGEARGGQLEQSLGSVADPDRLTEVGEWRFDCEIDDAFPPRVRKWVGQSGE